MQPQRVVAERDESVALEKALRRLRLNFYHLWRPLEELRTGSRPRPAPDSLLRGWREAPQPSREWRKARHYDEAVAVLSVSLGRSREETEGLVREYVFGRRLPVPAESHEDRL